MASFNGNYFLRGPVSKYTGGLRLHYNEFGEVEAQFGPQHSARQVILDLCEGRC